MQLASSSFRYQPGRKETGGSALNRQALVLLNASA